MSMVEPDPTVSRSSGGTDPKKRLVVFGLKEDLRRDPRAMDEFDIIVVEEPLPRWLRKKLKRLARRGKTVMLLRL